MRTLAFLLVVLACSAALSCGGPGRVQTVNSNKDMPKRSAATNG